MCCEANTWRLSPCAAPWIVHSPIWDKRHQVKVSLCQDFYFFGIRDTSTRCLLSQMGINARKEVNSCSSTRDGDWTRRGRYPLQDGQR